MPYVKLRGNWNGMFKRSIRDETGTIMRTLIFQKDEPVNLTVEEIEAVKNDLGKALLPLEWSDEKRKFVVIDLNEIDAEATAAQVAETSADGGPVEGAEVSESELTETALTEPALPGEKVPASEVSAADDRASEVAETVAETPSEAESTETENMEAQTNATANTGRRSRR